MTTREKLQERFVQLLRELTDQGKVEWVQESAPGYVHCMVGEECFKFEILGADKGYVRQKAHSTGSRRWHASAILPP